MSRRKSLTETPEERELRLIEKRAYQRRWRAGLNQEQKEERAISRRRRQTARNARPEVKSLIAIRRKAKLSSETIEQRSARLAKNRANTLRRRSDRAKWESDKARARSRYANASPERRRIFANREKEYRKKYLAKNVNFKLSDAVRKRYRDALRRHVTNGARVSATKNLGCSIEQFKRHIERQFVKGMTWDNWGYGNRRWHLDHIRPLASFDMTDPDQAKQALHFTNYRPLWGSANQHKSDKRELLL